MSIAIADWDALHFYASLLRQSNLLKEPEGGLELRQMDNVAAHRLWSSGANYNDLFRCKITHRLAPGELLIQNNLTWATLIRSPAPRITTPGIREFAEAFDSVMAAHAAHRDAAKAM